MKTELMEKRKRGTQLFPFQLYEMNNQGGSLFVPYHWHSEIEIIYVVKGTVQLLLNGDNILLEKEHIYFINREFLHQYSSIDKTTHYYAYVFPIEYLDFKIEDYSQTTTILPLIKDKEFPFCISSQNTCFERIRNEILEIIELNKTSPIAYQLNIKACIYKIISLLHRDNLFSDSTIDNQNKNRATKTSDIKKLLTYIQSEYQNTITLEDAASILNYTPKYFCTFFKSTFEISFIDYLNHFRIEKACLLLLNTNMSIMEVAFEVGFKNFSYFIRTFKKIMRICPREYRKGAVIKSK